jgi:hypothetical protein
MTRVYVKYIDGTFYICDIDGADFSIYSDEYDYDEIIKKINDPLWGKGQDLLHIYLGFQMDTNKGYDFFKNCKRSQKIRFIIDKIKKVY